MEVSCAIYAPLPTPPCPEQRHVTPPPCPEPVPLCSQLRLLHTTGLLHHDTSYASSMPMAYSTMSRSTPRYASSMPMAYSTMPLATLPACPESAPPCPPSNASPHALGLLHHAPSLLHLAQHLRLLHATSLLLYVPSYASSMLLA
ncbi:unnamed protein product [Nesidiocoris tenuis]|uniref:Uncharacterized protein n=1 Tax=Nesidiocoris tenuis TaxID=355587 RepID=A0A6H5GTR7_9HEMI|nr:unnamed protein product [Nesidiocoris tenuis]CAB0006168.1 unnamed protein product [Nesidiocoris tenuis]